MALGFGFNKTKVLQAAERFVLQGKLQNAIAEYEKILKSDARDLTVMNTVGDLYIRVGRLDDGLQCFRKVADAYSADGFMVKAIAMYKKMAKLSPSAGDCMLKLAELYGSQGLFSDARAQYTALAELHLRAGDTNAAINVYRKVLELDPENSGMQQRLADLYRRAGRNHEAAEIYIMAAQSLHCRQNFPAALEALQTVLSFEPRNEAALLLRAKIATDAGQHALAIQSLEAVPDLDQRADALRELLRAAAGAGDLACVEGTALKLLRVHNDPSGIVAAASAMVAAQSAERGMRFVREHVEAIAGVASALLVTFLNESIAQVKDNVPALEMICELYRIIGERGHSNEASELLAHAYAEEGKLAEARDLYRELAQLEPENPLHNQNCAQLTARLGETPSAAVELVDENTVVPDQLPDHEASVPQQYLSQIEEAIETALTDSELYQSYNAMPRAIAPLETVLLRAPEDVRVNQRLSALYVRVERYADAADRFAVLRTVFEREGLASEAAQCSEMEQKYRARAAAHPQPAAAAHSPAASATPGRAAEFEVAKVDAVASVDRDFSAPAAQSGEWDSIAQAEEMVPAASPSDPQKHPLHDNAARLGEILEEARFYVQQGMQREAQAALAVCRELAPDSVDVLALEAELLGVTQQSEATAPPEVEVQAEIAAQPEFAVTAPVAAAEPAPQAQLPVDDDRTLTAETVAAESQPAEAEAQVSASVPAEAAPASFELTELASMAAAALDKVLPPAKRQAASRRQPIITETPVVNPAEQAVTAAAFDLGWHVDDVPAAAASPAEASVSTAPPPARPARKLSPGNKPRHKESAPPAHAVPESPAAPEVRDDTFSIGGVFDQFRAEVEKSDGPADDLENRYNLGLALKDMGLLDEAIGELQKVCNAIDRGAAFGECVQAYTWLAHCLVERGFPQAAFKWYKRALELPSLDPDALVAIHYDLAQAYERAGIKDTALAHFMEAYGGNIDYRDVAERIHALQG